MTEIVEGFKGLIKNSNKLIKVLNSYIKLKESPGENAYIMEKRLTEIAKFTSALPEFNLKTSLITLLNQEKGSLAKAKDDFRFNFGQNLNELFLKDGKTIKGQYPTLRIGMYTIKLNFEFGEAVLYFGPEVEKIKSKIPLNPVAIFETIKKYNTELNAYKFEPQEFFNDLYNAYRKRILLANKSIGEKLLIVDVLNEFVNLKQPQQFFVDPKKENFREYPRVKLSFLLFLLRKSNLCERGLRFYVATFDATTDKRHSIWIPENEEGEGTYYSYIAFGKDQNT